MKSNKSTQDNSNYAALGMCLGISIGTAIGVASDTLSVSMPVGLSLGLCIGTLMDAQKRKESGNDAQMDTEDENG